MLFTRFGITLKRLDSNDLEDVRQWRNSPWVRPYMRYRRLISSEEQARWFQGLDPVRDWYFVAHCENDPVGLFHIKGVDWERRCGESGGFVGSASFIRRPEAAQATLALMDFAFLLLELGSLEAQYHPDAPKVARFNELLGYRVFREEPDGFVRACVTADRYFACAATVRKAAATLHGTAAVLTGADRALDLVIQNRAQASGPDFDLQIVSYLDETFAPRLLLHRDRHF